VTGQPIVAAMRHLVSPREEAKVIIVLRFYVIPIQQHATGFGKTTSFTASIVCCLVSALGPPQAAPLNSGVGVRFGSRLAARCTCSTGAPKRSAAVSGRR
jgi:hypothetical protein